MIMGTILFSQQFEVTSAPSWSTYKNEDITSTVSKYDVQSGTYLEESSLIVHFPKEQYFSKTRSKILNSAGIDHLSQIYIPFDTSYQKVQIHNVIIERDGKTIDKTNALSFSAINQEQDLASNVYTGMMAVHSIVDDLRKNDVLEISYSIIGFNPIFGQNYNDVYYLQDINPIDYLRVCLISSANTNLTVEIDDKSKLRDTSYVENGLNFYTVTQKNIESLHLEDYMSTSTISGNRMQYSSFKSWKEVKLWGIKLFECPTSEDLKESFHKIVKTNSSTVENATLLLDYVQNEIRYTSINGGIGSFKPTSPDKVLQRRYGDCKDKSLLLVRLLRELGLDESYPVLVNSGSGKNLDNYLPGSSLFNHVIVKTEIDDEVIYIDPTFALQGGSIKDRALVDYGYALALDDSETGLEKMPEVNKSSTVISELFDFSDVSKEGKISVKTVLVGSEANGVRMMYDYYSPKDIEEAFKEVYSKIYLDVNNIGRVKVEDDLETNTITIYEEYRVSNPWSDYEYNSFTGKGFVYEGCNFYNYIAPLACDEVIYEIDFGGDIHIKQTTEFLLPEDTIYKVENVNTKNPVYSFSKKHKITNLSKSNLEMELKIPHNTINPKDFKQACKEINENYRKLQIQFVKSN